MIMQSVFRRTPRIAVAVVAAIGAMLLTLIPGAGALAQTQGATAPPATAPSGPIAGTPPAPAAGSNAIEGYVIGVGDVIEVSVLGREDYKARVQVQVDGTVQLPLIKDVKALDRTVLQLRNDIRTALIQGQYFNDPAVSVVVAGFSSRYVTVLGEVATPGLMPIDRPYRLSEIIARAGGLKPTAADEIRLTRSTGETQTYDIKQLASGGNAQDPSVNPTDRIFVDKVAEFYVTGAVNAPGVHPLRANMTLRMAIARAGGVSAMGSMKRVKVFRDGKQIPKYGLEQPIQAGDSIEVGERLF